MSLTEWASTSAAQPNIDSFFTYKGPDRSLSTQSDDCLTIERSNRVEGWQMVFGASVRSFGGPHHELVRPLPIEEQTQSAHEKNRLSVYIDRACMTCRVCQYAVESFAPVLSLVLGPGYSVYDNQDNSE